MNSARAAPCPPPAAGYRAGRPTRRGWPGRASRAGPARPAPASSEAARASPSTASAVGVLDAGEPLDEVAPAQLAPHLGPGQPGGQVAPGGGPGVELDRLPGEHPVAIEQGRGPGEVRPPRGRPTRGRRRSTIAPRAVSTPIRRNERPRPRLGRPAAEAADEGLGHRLAAGPERVEAVVGDQPPTDQRSRAPAGPPTGPGRSPGRRRRRSSPPDGPGGRGPGPRCAVGLGDVLADGPGAGEVARDEGDPGLAPAVGLGPPGPVARAERLVEPGRAEVLDPPREEVRLPEVGRRGEPLELLQGQADGREPLRGGWPGGRAGGGRRSRRTPRAGPPRSRASGSRSRAAGPPPGSAGRPTAGRPTPRPGRAGPVPPRRRTARGGPSPSPGRSDSGPSGRPGRSGRGSGGSGGRSVAMAASSSSSGSPPLRERAGVRVVADHRSEARSAVGASPLTPALPRGERERFRVGLLGGSASERRRIERPDPHPR